MPKVTNPTDQEVVLHYAGTPYRIAALGSITVESPEVAAKLEGDLAVLGKPVLTGRKGK